MMHDDLRNTPLARSLADVMADVSNLIRKELQLARAEVSAKVSTKVQAGIWLAVSGLLGVIALILVLQALVFGIASFGIAVHWSCLIVAALVAVGATVAYSRGQADLREDMTPSRTINQIKQDFSAVKEQTS